MKTLSLKISTLVLILFGIIPTISFAQNTKTWEWGSNIVGTNKNYPYALYTDADGNNYVAGSFSDTLKVGNVKLISRGSFDMYLLKYNATGKLLWAKQAGGTDSDEAYAIAADGDGNLYVTGYFSGTADFSSIKIKSNGDRNFFLAKYTTNGDAVWVKQGGGASEDYGTAVAVDGSGSICITGIFKGSMTLGSSNYVSKGDKDLFVIKYDDKGNILWSTTGGGSATDESTSITMDITGNCIVSGDFEGTFDMNKKIIVSAGMKDVFVAKFSLTGTLIWLKRAGSAQGDDHVSSIVADVADNIFLTGYFSGMANFGKTDLKNMGGDDIFLVKLDPNGNEVWAKQTGGKGNEHARGMKLDKMGNIYLVGEFNVDFTFGANNIKNLGDWDIFILKYSEKGDMLGGTQLSGVGFDKGYGIGLDNQANVYITGFFSKAISIGTTNLKSIDADDGFIAKLKGL